MSTSNLYGSLISGATVERRIASFVADEKVVDAQAGTTGTWLETYFAEIERVEGYAAEGVHLERPLSVVAASDLDRWPEDQLPILVVVCPGILAKPERRGDGSYRAPFTVTFSPIVSADMEGSTRRLAQAHAVAMRALVLQHKSLGGLADDVEWLAERYDDVPFEQTRTLQAGMVAFTVWVPQVVEEFSGPMVPSPTPSVDRGPGPPPTAVTVGVTPIPITEKVHP